MNKRTLLLKAFLPHCGIQSQADRAFVQCAGWMRFPFSFFLSFFLLWLRRMACRILVPQPGLEPGSPAVEARIPNPRTAREFPACLFQGFAWQGLCCQPVAGWCLQLVIPGPPGGRTQGHGVLFVLQTRFKTVGIQTPKARRNLFRSLFFGLITC